MSTEQQHDCNCKEDGSYDGCTGLCRVPVMTAHDMFARSPKEAFDEERRHFHDRGSR